MMRTALSIILLLSGISLWAQDSSWRERIKLKGYVKLMQTNSFANPDTIFTDNLIHNRLNFKYRSKNSKWSAALEMRNRIVYGDQYRLIPNFSEQLIAYDGVMDLEWIWAETPTWSGTTVIDRVYLDYQSSKWEARLGRQRINWGMNLVWNPNDVFNSFNYLDFDYEERPGSDAARVRFFGKKMRSFELAYKWSPSPDSTVLAAKYGFNKGNYDFQIIAGQFHRNLVLGGGWAGSLGMVGFKGELSAFIPVGFNQVDTTTSVSFSPTLDYSFSSGWYVLGSYLLNSNGVTAPLAADGFFRQVPDAKNLMPNRHSFILQTSKSFTPVFTGSLAAMYGAGVNWLILFPTFTYSFRQDFDFSLVAQTLFSEGQPGDFGMSGNSIFLRFKYSF